MIQKPIVQPVQPEVIDADPSVRCSFQADAEFRQIYVSSKKAERTYEITEKAVSSAARLAEVAGLPTIERIVATSPKSRFIVFSLDAKTAEPPGPRIFGLTTEPSVTLDDAISFVRPLL